MIYALNFFNALYASNSFNALYASTVQSLAL